MPYKEALTYNLITQTLLCFQHSLFLEKAFENF